jgi:hypothetical protein
MLLIEYLNVLTRGVFQQMLLGRKWRQYLLAGVLGATPGCLGAFAVVAMYSHRTITLGAVVTAMIATFGDEAFVMLAAAPRAGLLLIGILFAISLPVGWLTDVVFRFRLTRPPETHQLFEVHEVESCFAHGRILGQWRHCTLARGILAAVLVLFLTGVIFGFIGMHGGHADEAYAGDAPGVASADDHESWETWIPWTVALVTLVALFIVATVPDHFLDEHLWRHVLRRHLLRVFLWTAGALLLIYLLEKHLDVESHVRDSRWIVLLIACAVGMIPESGPHMIFIFFYVDGVIPFSILLASSIVQDGHGMIPMLAHSRRAFLGVKLINLVAGLAAGTLLLAFGL